MNNFIPFRISWKDVVVTMVVLGLFVSYYNFFNRDVDSVAYYCYFVTYCCLILCGLFFIKKFFWFKKNGTKTIGTVVNVPIDGNGDGGPVLEICFKDNSSTENKVKLSTLSFLRSWKKGDTIHVLYDPKCPKNAIVDDILLLFNGFMLVVVPFFFI